MRADVDLLEGETGAASVLGGQGLQLVTFFLGGEVFAFPLTDVREIIRLPEMVPVPLSPPSLEGLANLRGTLLPVVNLNRVLFSTVADHSEATRVVVVQCGGLLGFTVERVDRVVTANPEKMERVTSKHSGVATSQIAGVIKDVAEHAMVIVLDTVNLVGQEFSRLAVPPLDKKSVLGESLSREPARVQGAPKVELMQLVSFLLAGQEYAFPIATVKEIVRIPADVGHIPRSDANLVGIINLRNKILALVSLAGMFGLYENEQDENRRVVVITIRIGNAVEKNVGIVVDQVKEVLRVPVETSAGMPSMFSQDTNLAEIKSICRLNNGERLVSILNVEYLFEHPSIQDAIRVQAGQNEGDDNMSALEVGLGSKIREIQLVVFNLGADEFGVPIEAVQEIIRVPEQLTHVPKSPDYVEGMLNLRGVMLPVVDLRTRLGLEKMAHGERQRIVVFTKNGFKTGFIVDSVTEVLKISSSVIDSTPRLSGEQVRIMDRVAKLDGRMVLILEVDQLLADVEAQPL